MIIAYIAAIVCAIPTATALFLTIAEVQKGDFERAARHAVIIVICVGSIIAINYLADDKNFIRETDTENISTEATDTQISTDVQEDF